MSSSAALPTNTIIGGHWRVSQFLGEGACAKVYAVTETEKESAFPVVAKVIPLPSSKAKSKSKKDKDQERVCNTLSYEYILYTGILYGFPCCPRNPPKFYGDDLTLGVRFLVMERLDVDLVGFAKRGVPSPAVVADIGLQIIEGLKWLHGKTFLFVDVKPDNFMMKGDKVYFVDFGLTERVQSSPPPGPVQFNGTPTFSSVSADRCEALTYRDDIEALGYVLLSLFSNGQLPWSNAQSQDELVNMKLTADLTSMASNYNSAEIAEIIIHCRNLKGKSRPDYDKCIALLQTLKNRKTSGQLPTKGKERKSSTAVPKEPLQKQICESSLDIEEVQVVAKEVPSKRTRKTSKQNEEEVIELQTSKNTRSKSKAEEPINSIPEPQPTKKPVMSKKVDDKTAADDESDDPPPRKRSTKKVASVITVAEDSLESAKSAIVVSPLALDVEKDLLCETSFSPEQRNRQHSRVAQSTIGLVDGPFSSTNALVSAAPIRPVGRVPTGTLKVRVCRSSEIISAHDLLCPDTKTKECIYSIGKGQDCDISLPFEKEAASRHLKIKITKDDINILDESNGHMHTLVDGLIIPKRRWKRVHSGYDVILIGTTKIEI